LNPPYCPGDVLAMTIAQSRLTSQGQVSIPAEVRRRLGLEPGSIIEWDEDGERIIVRRAGRYSSAEVHATLFPQGAGAPRQLQDLKDGLRANVRRRLARH
jgi:antitoxin PrlF